MIILKGRVVEGARNFCWRMTESAAAFRDATGEYLYPGTLNVKVEIAVPLKEQFRVKGKDVGVPGQDILFEICRINRLWAYRVCTSPRDSADPAHSDDIFEIICAQKIPNALPGSGVTIELLRDDIAQPKRSPFQIRQDARSGLTLLPVLRRVDPPIASQKYRKPRLVGR